MDNDTNVITREEQKDFVDPILAEAVKIWGNTPRMRLAADLIVRAFVAGKRAGVKETKESA
jgi:hypothetical protein